MASLLGDIGMPILGAMGTTAAGRQMRKGLNRAGDRLKTGYGGAEDAYNPIYSGSLGAYQNLLGEYGEGGFDVDPSEFEASPGYQFALDQMKEQMGGQAAAGGMGHSPITTQALMKRAGGMASQEYGDWFDRQMRGKAQRFGMGQQLTSPMLPSAGGIASARTGLGQSLADIEAQQGAISGSIAASPFMAGQSILGSVSQRLPGAVGATPGGQNFMKNNPFMAQLLGMGG